MTLSFRTVVSALVLTAMTCLLLTPQASAVAILYDDFNDNSMNRSKWDPYDEPQYAHERNGHLEMYNHSNPPSGGTASTRCTPWGQIDPDVVGFSFTVVDTGSPVTLYRSRIFLSHYPSQEDDPTALRMDHNGRETSPRDYSAGDELHFFVDDAGNASIYVNGELFLTGTGFDRSRTTVILNTWNSGSFLYIDNAYIHTENPFAPEVPEPATLLAGLAGLAGIGRYLKRR